MTLRLILIIYVMKSRSRKDVKILAYELGHAFQMAMFNQNNSIPDFILPTKEAYNIKKSLYKIILIFDKSNFLVKLTERVLCWKIVELRRQLFFY